MTAIGLAPHQERALNGFGLLAMLSVLLGAIAYQFAFRDVPCTLCLLQRLAMLAVAYGAAMNLRIGLTPRHYGVIMVGAVFGLAISIRQSLLHINPYFDTEKGEPTLDPGTNPPFGDPVLGLDLYIWGVILFVSVFLAVGLVRLLRRPRGAAQLGMPQGTPQGTPQSASQQAPDPAWLDRFALFGVGLLFLVAAAQVVLVLLECGLGDCPNDGGWTWKLLD